MISQQEALFNGPPPAQNHEEPIIQEKREQEDQNLVVATKVSSRVNKFSIKQIYEQVTKNQPVSVQQINPPSTQPDEFPKKQMIIKHRLSVTEKDKKKNANLFGQLDEEAMQNVQNLIDIYKFSNCNRFLSDITQRTRSQFKQKVSLYLFYGIQELKLISNKQLTDIQKSLLEKNSEQIIKYVKDLSLEIELCMIRFHNKFYKMKLERPYKDRANILLINFKDETNEQLRRKTLNKIMTPQMLTTGKEIDLYTSARRQEMLIRSRNIMAQSTLEYRKNDEDQQMAIDAIKQEKQIEEKEEIVEKQLENKEALQILQLMNKHIDGFYTKLNNDLPTNQAKLLCSHLDLTFTGRKIRT